MEFRKEFGNYIEQIKTKVNGMKMVAANVYPSGIGIRATDGFYKENPSTKDICDLFYGSVYNNGREITNLYEIVDGCKCVVSDQIMINNTLIQFRIGAYYKVTDVVDINDNVYFTIKEI